MKIYDNKLNFFEFPKLINASDLFKRIVCELCFTPDFFMNNYFSKERINLGRRRIELPGIMEISVWDFSHLLIKALVRLRLLFVICIRDELQPPPSSTPPSFALASRWHLAVYSYHTPPAEHSLPFSLSFSFGWWP